MFRKNGLDVDNEAYRASWSGKMDIGRSGIFELEDDEHAGEELVEKLSEEVRGKALVA